MRRPLLALSLVVVLAAAGAGCSDDDGDDGAAVSSTTAPAGFDAKATDELRPLVDALVALVPILQQWRDGKTDGPAAVAALDDFTKRAAPVPAAVAALRATGEEQIARDRYVASARLYREVAVVTRAAVTTAEPALGRQVDRIGSRLRILADRIYDRGKLTLEPGAFDTTSDQVEIRRPTDVPEWVAEGLSAGPPLDDEPPPAAATPPERNTFRSEQPEADWRKSIAAAGIPPATDLAKALDGKDLAVLRTLARRLQAVARSLDEVADPEGGRERAAAVRLGLLVQAEAARTAQAALLGPAEAAPGLQAAAQRMALIGDSLWDDALPARRSGLDPAFLDRA